MPSRSVLPCTAIPVHSYVDVGAVRAGFGKPYRAHDPNPKGTNAPRLSDPIPHKISAH